MIVVLLAILKAVGSYQPLDPHYPQERLAFMPADSRARVLLTHTAIHDVIHGAVMHGLASQAHGNPPTIVHLDADAHAIASAPAREPEVALDPRHPAYVIYTSGSTGIPKAVVISHAGIPNLAAAQIEHFSIDAHARVLQFASLNFDAAVSEIVTTLLAGAALVLPPALRTDGDVLARVLREQSIT